jgi:hypothetical protein
VTDVPDYLKDFAQIRLIGPDGEIEVVWAIVFGNYFRVRDYPLYAIGISRLDIIEATKVAPQDWNGLGTAGSAGVFEFVRVHTPSGIRVLRILFDSPMDEESRTDLLDHLETMNCEYGGNEHRLSVGVPPKASIDDVRAYLDACGFRWEDANPVDQVA